MTTSLLEALARDTWTPQVVANHGAPCVHVALRWMDREPMVVATDAYTVTWRHLDPEALRGDTPNASAYIDGEILKTIQAHLQPYNRYPHAAAPDELAYLS